MKKKKLIKSGSSEGNSASNDEIKKKHKEAVKKGEDTYIDPETGYMVFTAEYLIKRGFCCGCGCRHCPY
jgi:hypothetical protein